MTYRIAFKPSAEKAYLRLEFITRRRIAKKLDALVENPRAVGVEKLEGDDNLWRVRVGDHRIVYEIHDDRVMVLVVRIGHRREIYRAL